MHTNARRPLALLSMLASAALLAACGSTTKLDQPAPVATSAAAAPAAATPAAAGTAAASGTPQSQVATVDLASRAAPAGSSRSAGAPADAMVAQPTERVVYFDFDSFALRPEFAGMVEGHAKYLSFNRDKRIAIEGHTDERGSREYNLALGQKRAEAVLRSLVLLGAQESQIEAVSFGEERASASGSDEAAWAQNRRAEVKDR